MDGCARVGDRLSSLHAFRSPLPAAVDDRRPHEMPPARYVLEFQRAMLFCSWMQRRPGWVDQDYSVADFWLSACNDWLHTNGHTTSRYRAVSWQPLAAAVIASNVPYANVQQSLRYMRCGLIPFGDFPKLRSDWRVAIAGASAPKPLRLSEPELRPAAFETQIRPGAV